jgi:hypothetical protein
VDSLLGVDNTLLDYLLVLLVYGGLFIAIRQAGTQIPSDFRRSFMVLYVVWALGIFVGNYLFFLLGIMSFIPWLNNFIHAFIWIGLCLGFLYAIGHERPLWQQLVLFAVYSFVVKVTENYVLGSWDLNHFFFVDGNLAYILGWSLVDAAYPLGSFAVLSIASRFISGLIVPKLKLT